MTFRVNSFGTIPEWEHTEEKQDAFSYWVTFQFQNELNSILVIPLPKVEWTKSFWKRIIRPTEKL